MADQAAGWRSSRRAAATADVRGRADDEPSPTAILAASPDARDRLLFTSGKGGVGTSNLVLNLAIALGEMDQRVVVIDADIGLANLDLLCGLTPRYDLGDVLAGRCRLVDALVTGPARSRLCPGRTRSARRRGRPGRGAGAAGRRAERARGRSPTLCWWMRARAWGRA